MLLSLLFPLVLLPNAHAHNDYAHPRPLLDALDQGFLNLEADIFLVDGRLLVGHNREDLKPERTLEALYLDPLAERARKWGNVYGQYGPLTLMIDLKEDGARLQPELRKHLDKYRFMLTDRVGNTVRGRAVQIVLSGARTDDCGVGDGPLFKDGQPKDMADDPARTPWISDSYSSSLGPLASPLPALGRAKLDALVAKAHASGKRVRLWGGPDGPATWAEERAAGVDLINTDRLADLRGFLLSSPIGQKTH